VESFPIRVSDVIRYADMDRQGHVKNAVFSTYFESGRVGLIYDPVDGLQVPGCTQVMAQLNISFLKELRWPGAVDIGTAVAAIGHSSYTLTQAIFHDETCAGTAIATLVVIDRETRRARPLPPELIGRLERLRLRE
jgi:acyl-CoA thioester hydrolase